MPAFAGHTTAREVFPQAAHPVSCVERVMGHLGHEGHFHETCSALGSGWSFQSQYRPSTSYRYSLLHRRQPMLRLRLSIYPSPQLLQTHGCLCHLTPASPWTDGVLTGPGPSLRARLVARLSTVLRPDPPPGRLRRHFPLTVIGGASSVGFPHRAPRASPVDTSSFVPCRR
jgi:hypothetical protein